MFWFHKTLPAMTEFHYNGNFQYFNLWGKKSVKVQVN